MSFELFPPIPIETVKSARAVFGRSNYYLAVGDQANQLFSGLHLAGPAEKNMKEERRLAILHLVTIFQFLETLPDILAMDALRERVDWKYALHLPLHYLFREFSSFCEFRSGLRLDRARLDNFQTLLSRLSGVTERIGTHHLNIAAEKVIASVCGTSRLAQIWDTMSHCLESLAIKRHAWLRANSLPHWYERYGLLARDLNLRAEGAEPEAFAQWIGADGIYLLERISSGDAPELAELPEVQALRQVWSEQYELSGRKLCWKKEACSSCSLLSNHQFPVF